jgi:hypothetical protein
MFIASYSLFFFRSVRSDTCMNLRRRNYMALLRSAMTISRRL